MRSRRRVAAGGLVLAMAAALAGCGPEQPWVNELVSTNAAGTAPGDGDSLYPVFSPDGRYLAFESWASDLGPAGTGGSGHLFLRELATGEVTVLDTTPAGDPGNGRGWRPVFSADGSTVVFNSAATDIVPGAPADSSEHLYVRDLATGATELVTANLPGRGTATWGGQTESVSADGNLVLFTSYADDLVPDDTNGAQDVFLRDVAAGTTTLVSVDAAGTRPADQGASIGDPRLSPDGTKVVFASLSTDLGYTDTNGDYDVFVRDLVAGTTTLLTANADGTDTGNGHSFAAGWAQGGATVLVSTTASDLGPTDTNGTDDVIAYDVATGEPRAVSTDAGGTRTAGGFTHLEAISPDGRRVAVTTTASDLGPVDSDCVNGWATPPDPPPTGPCIDLYVRDLVTGEATLVTTNPEGTDSNRHGGGQDYGFVSFSPDGSRLVFTTGARGLGPADANRNVDVYVRDLVEGTTTLVSHRADQGGSADGWSTQPHVSPDGRQVAYWSFAPDITPVADTGGHTDVFLATFEAAELTVTLDTPTSVPAGGTAAYTLRVTNDGPDVADATEVTLALPEGTTFASASGPCTAPPPSAPRGISCDLGTVDVRESVEITFTATVTAAAGAELTAYATADARPADTDRTDNTADATTTVS